MSSIPTAKISQPFKAGRHELELLTAIGCATLLGAFFLQYVVGLQPCELCLQQRYAYYLVLFLCGWLWPGYVSGPRPMLAQTGFILITLLMASNAGLGIYHSGVEWGWWAGPTACTGPVTDFGPAGSLLGRLDAVKVVRCDEAQFRLLGLSLAGYNVLISTAMAVIAGWGGLSVFARRHFHGI